MNKLPLIIIIGMAFMMIVGYFIGYFSYDENSLKTQKPYYAYQINQKGQFIPALLSDELSCMTEVISYHTKLSITTQQIVYLPDCLLYSLKSDLPVYIMDTISNTVIEVGVFESRGGNSQIFRSGFIYADLINEKPYKLQ